MAGKLTQQEEVDNARLRLKLLAERLELESQLARQRSGSALKQGLAAIAGDRTLLTLGGSAILSLVAGAVLARQPRWRTAALALLARQLSR